MSANSPGNRERSSSGSGAGSAGIADFHELESARTMAIRVALNHKTEYHYDRPVTMTPQIVRLRPAPHGRTPILSYSLKVTPREHFLNWQQDPYSNYLARLVIPKPSREFKVE